MHKVPLGSIKEDLYLEIAGKENTFFEISEEEVSEFGEAKFQIKEGCRYEYKFSNKEYKFKISNGNPVLSPSSFGSHRGVLNPNIYVGTLSLPVVDKDGNEVDTVKLEVRSVKETYREEYKLMLEHITDRCTDLIMQMDAPINQYFETDFNVKSQTLYQRFSFVKSLIDSKEFEEAVQEIVANPTTAWQDEPELTDIRSVRKFNKKSIRELVARKNRTPVPDGFKIGNNSSIVSIPSHIETVRKIESLDTPENRFVKHSLEEFLFFCDNCHEKFHPSSRANLEAKILSNKVSRLLNQTFFREIGRPTTLRINSPVLQRKNGYREILNAWLKYDLAAKLIWKGGDNVYEAGKKDIATLYEYWLFFTLLDLMQEVFKIKPVELEQLISLDKHGISVNLQQGKKIALKGIYESKSRNLNIEFFYNKSFGGGKTYPKSGSYTTTLRPDYTLSIWPSFLDREKAEESEMITHIHFDAKYKVNNFRELIAEKATDEDLNIEKLEVKQGTVKNVDLLKMHAYKDAIRRTGGAYVLYPGEGTTAPFKGFHELIPGLGAFVVKPNATEDYKNELKDFIKKVVAHFEDRASQRENFAIKKYKIHKETPKDEDRLLEPIPDYTGDEFINANETHVLIGYCKSEEQYKWIKANKKYNFRMNSDQGSLPLGIDTIGAKYLLLHGKDQKASNDIWRIIGRGPKLYSREALKKNGYPNPKQDFYLVVSLEKVDLADFGNNTWDFRALINYKKGRASAMPYTATLAELQSAKVIVKDV